jgi:hypothetical protein
MEDFAPGEGMDSERELRKELTYGTR